MPAPFFSAARLPSTAHNPFPRFPPFLPRLVRCYSLVLITTWMPLPSSNLANFLASESEPTIAP